MSDSVESSNNNHESSENNSESNDDNNSNSMPSDEDNSNFEYDSTSDYNYEEDDEEEEQNVSLYNQHPVSCPICCDDKIEEGCAVILPNCSHSFCTACFNAYIETQIGSGNADNITCPHIVEKVERCNASVSMEVLYEIMTEESYTRLKQQKENAFVRKNADYHHCPTPDCDNIVLCPQTSEGELRICDCFKCGQTSCLECGVTPFHMSFSCDEYKEYQRRKRARHDRELQSIRFDPFGMSRYNQVDRSRANEETRFDFNVESSQSSNDNTTGDSNTTNDALSNIKRCRRCGNGVELESGCLKMKCICGYRFCYQCGAENAICDCTPSHHGFFDNQNGMGDFAGLRETKSYT